MSFADWKKRSRVYKETIDRNMFAWPDIEDACAAAYKAGQRDGMKVAEAMTAEQLQDQTEAAGGASDSTRKLDIGD